MTKELPKGWIYITLGELFHIERGGSPRPISDYLTKNEDGINWIKIGDTKGITKYIYKTEEKIRPEGLYKSRMVYEDDFILSNSMSFGRPYIMKTSGCIHDGWLVIRPNKKIIDSNYLYYKLSSSFVYQQFSELAKGSTVRNLNIAAVQKVNIYVPPLPVQQRIVAKLDTLFGQLDKIKTHLEHIPQLLKDFRQSVLTQAVTGKLTEEWREGRELEKWKTEALGNVLKDVKYGTSKKSDYETIGTPILRIPNIKDGEIDISDLKFSILDDNEYNSLKLIEGDVLIIRSNGSVSLVGQSAIIRKNLEGYSYAGYLIRLRVKKALHPDYLNYALESYSLREQIVETARSTSGVNNINSQEIKDLIISYPSIEEQKEIVSRVESLFTKADKIEAQYQTLKEKIEQLPQAILAKAFRGKLVEQLPTDGDARDLLEEIKKVKAGGKKLLTDETMSYAAEPEKGYGKK